MSCPFFMIEKCPICKVNNRASNGHGARKALCNSCTRKPYTRHKKEYCEECSFVAKHRVQLDVDHVDGNKKNNDLSNLKTLCANCHRLKTLESGDAWNIGHKKHFEDTKITYIGEDE